jgi:hypothetical protein
MNINFTKFTIELKAYIIDIIYEEIYKNLKSFDMLLKHLKIIGRASKWVEFFSGLGLKFEPGFFRAF